MTWRSMPYREWEQVMLRELLKAERIATGRNNLASQESHGHKKLQPPVACPTFDLIPRVLQSDRSNSPDQANTRKSPGVGHQPARALGGAPDNLFKRQSKPAVFLHLGKQDQNRHTQTMPLPHTLSPSTTPSDTTILHDHYNPLGLFSTPVLVPNPPPSSHRPPQRHNPPLIVSTPLFTPLLFENDNSTCRDHCAAERTFLSWLRLSIYMAIVATAILISFHLKHKATKLERRIALPLGIVFWVLAVACLGAGVVNYVKTVERYGRRQALVQSGWGTQVIFTVVAVAIVASCILFLTLEVEKSSV